MTRKAAWARRLEIIWLMQGLNRCLGSQQGVREDVGMSMRDVAFWLGLSPSTCLMRRIRECVAMGFLSERKSEYRPGIMASKFYLTDEGRAMSVKIEENG